MTDERNLWDELRDKVGPYGKLKRIENSCDLGTPDVSFLLKRFPTAPPVAGWVELKIGKVRATGRIVIESLTKEQVLWQEDWAQFGGRAFTFIRVLQKGAEDDHAMVDPGTLRRIFARTVDFPTLPALSKKYWIGPFIPHEVIKCLTES